MLFYKIRTLGEISWKHLIGKNYIRCCKGGRLNISKTVNILNSKIIILPGGHITIGNHCMISNMNIVVSQGDLVIGDHCFIGSKSSEKETIDISQGKIIIDHHVKIDCKKLWVRFGGSLRIGSYTNINKGSEVRCDEKVTIGSYNQISYNVRIWDTNTHNILPVSNRRKLAVDYFPRLGMELQKPITAPVEIGDDCWIGENAAIMKGSIIGNEVIIGFGTMVLAETIPDRSTAYNSKKIFLLKRE